ncbi:hypothetical protein ACFV4N_09580 [Actinosynnema sp. NPDC059797]
MGTVRLAASAAGACLVVSLATGLGIHYLPRGEEPPPNALPTAPADGEPGTDDVYGTWPYPMETTSAPGTTSTRPRNGPGTTAYATAPSEPVPAGYRRVSGAGLSTVVPESFDLEVPKSAVATDPYDDDFQARFGGDAYGPDSLWDTVGEAEGQVAARTAGYRRATLARVSYDGFEAVEWEYRYTGASGVALHSRALYWRERGLEYVLYVTGAEPRWDEATELFAAMVTHCRLV